MKLLTVASIAMVSALATTGVCGTATAAPAAGTARDMSIGIHGHTSPLFDLDSSPDGTGPLEPATRVRAVLRNCPVGDYLMSATLVQDGVSYPWAAGGLGAGEVFCTSAGPVARRTSIAMTFTGEGLHPGRATATFAVQPCCGDGPTASATARVWVKHSR